MRILIAPQSFKGSLTAAQAGQAIAQGVRAAYPLAEIEIVPIADGGEGTLSALVDHFQGEIAKMTATIPNDRLAIQWDVCQEVLAWEGYYQPGPVDFRSETLGVLAAIGGAAPAGVELGYHFCYGSPADEHCVQPKDMGIMVEMANAVSDRVRRPIQFFHMPVPKGRTDDAYFAPLAILRYRRS